jgi:hypothetical protein
MRGSPSIVVAALHVALVVSACGGANKESRAGVGAGGRLADAPPWLFDCRAAFPGDPQPPLCGVGLMDGTRNISLCRDAAKGRGRAEIAETLDSTVRRLSKDYRRNVTAGAGHGSVADDEQAVTVASKEITNIALPGTRVVSWWAGSDGDCAVVMALDLEAFERAVGSARSLDPALRDYVVENAREAFEELARETAARPRRDAAPEGTEPNPDAE